MENDDLMYLTSKPSYYATQDFCLKIFSFSGGSSLKSHPLQKMTTTSRKLRHSAEVSLTVFKIENAAKRTRQHAGNKYRKTEYVLRCVCFVIEQVP